MAFPVIFFCIDIIRLLKASICKWDGLPHQRNGLRILIANRIRHFWMLLLCLFFLSVLYLLVVVFFLSGHRSLFFSFSKPKTIRFIWFHFIRACKSPGSKGKRAANLNISRPTSTRFSNWCILVVDRTSNRIRTEFYCYFILFVSFFFTSFYMDMFLPSLADGSVGLPRTWIHRLTWKTIK